MGKETEYKLAVGDLQLLDCILCSRMVMEKLCAPYAYIRMRTTYYDTEDGFLAQRRWMLRLRTEDARSVVTMKTPAPICGASFTRITAELRLSENTSCMICGDVGDLTGGGRTALLCELELELKQGSEEALSAFARALMDTYHLSEQPLSKLQRARALAE